VPESTAIRGDRIAISALPGAERAVAAEHWTALERTVGQPALSCSWAWTETWLAHYGDVVPHRFLLGSADGEPRGIALVTEAPRRPLRPRTLHLGTAGEPPGSSVYVERNALLVAPADRAAFATALIDRLTADGGWDRLRFDGLRAEDAEALLAGRADVTRDEQESPIADLTAGEDVVDALSGSRRQRVRRALRGFGDVDVDAEWAQTPAQGLAILDELIDLHQARWSAEGAPGAFASERFTAFHRALIERLLPEGRVALLRVHRGAEVVGCLYGFVEDGRLLFYQSGLRRYEDNRLKAGVVAHVAFMRACRDRGLTTYDFLAPAVRYKQELSTRAEQLTWGELTRRGWRTRLAQVAKGISRSSD
jgi:CelD/BcsL family acetyltransferase involved in cellulose biosynthesis